ncbi:RNA polymerase sigma factor [Gaetbulibacter aestuarii]|uniref:Sigma-70 family RNA polymerase sigma factor n=1 Tax=Gaetbulibacter aestuarii TaxID=1502358 RepID=A0ABW7MZ28_9FLAO
MTNNDEHYINQISMGDTNAFAVLVDRYKDLVFTLALRMLKNRDEAEEVAQDTFVKVYRSLKRFKGDSKFSTWVYRITYNTCLDRIKKNKNFNSNYSVDEFTDLQLKSIDNALDNLDLKERQKTIQNCIDHLDEEDSFLITLYYYDDLSMEEIGKTVNLTANNVKVKLFRIRKKLASILRQHLEPEVIEYYERER